jgi:uncharacterized RDD family membrane protein YckC
MAFGLKVTDRSGRRISFGRAVGRNLSKFFGWYSVPIGSVITGSEVGRHPGTDVGACLIYPGIDRSLADYTRKHQALHDMSAVTLVVRSCKRKLACGPG